ncbi:MAG: hypothetical protein ACLFS0_01050 [Bacteroidales bacterium]
MEGSGKHVSIRLIISLGLYSAAIIAFQLGLMQLISIVQWHHFAYMIISVAMLGFGAGGTLLALARERLIKASRWLVPLLMSVSGLFMMVTFHLTRMEFFRFDVYLLFVESSQFPILAANYIIYFIPFFTGALAIGIIFIKYSSKIGTYYFANLVGSGIGGLLVLFLLDRLMPQQVPAVVGVFAVMAALVMLTPVRRTLQLSIAGLSLAVAIVLISRPGDIPLSEYKDLARTMDLPEAEIIHSQPDIHGFIEVASSPALRFAPALSLSYTGDVPVKKNIFVNANRYGVIPGYQPGQTEHILDQTTQELPWVVAKKKRVLMMNAGEGAPLAHAFTRGAGHIDAVIPNRGVVSVMQNEFAEESGRLFLHDSLDIYQVEPRNFLASGAKGSYDLIILPQQDAFGGTAGINALREDYTMTVESFGLMWEHLKDDGFIAVSTWIDYPSRTSLKLLATLVATLEDNGISNPEDHIAAIRSWGTISFAMKKSPLTTEEAGRIRNLCREKYFDPLLLPDISHGERQQFNVLEDEDLFVYADRIMEGDQSFLQDYGFMIDPATDNKPYFAQFLRIGNIGKMSALFGQDQVPFLELGYLIVVVTLVQSTILAVLFILLPLLRIRKSHRRKGGTLLYFGALGVGYMFVEIILIQRFVLYFGEPVFALSAVISTMLIASGMGSLTSNRLPATPATISSMGMLVAMLLLGYTFFLTPILQWSIAGPLAAKIILSLILIGVPAFFKGMMFPFGIRYLSGYDKSQVPWAYGIDGSVSVISTSLATLIALEAGFMLVMAVAVGCYTLAFATFAMHRRVFR